MPSLDLYGQQSGAAFDQLTAQFTAFRAAFDEELGAALSFDFLPFVLQQELNGALTLDLETVRGIALMREWAGTRVVEDALQGFDNVIKTRKYVATESIQRDEYNANPNGLGLITSKIAGLADESAQHVLRMFAAVLEGNGQSVSALTAAGIEPDLAKLGSMKALDGKALFAVDHPLANGATYSNLSTGGHSTANFTASMTAMKKIPEWLHGRRIDNRPTHVLTPIGLTPRYKQLLESQYDPDKANKANNPNLNAVQLVECPFLMDDTKVYLINARRAQMKPIVHAITYPAHLDQQIDPQSDSVYDRDAYKFGANGRYVMVPGHAFTAFCITA